MKQLIVAISVIAAVACGKQAQDNLSATNTAPQIRLVEVPNLAAQSSTTKQSTGSYTVGNFVTVKVFQSIYDVTISAYDSIDGMILPTTATPRGSVGPNWFALGYVCLTQDVTPAYVQGLAEALKNSTVAKGEEDIYGTTVRWIDQLTRNQSDAITPESIVYNKVISSKFKFLATDDKCKKMAVFSKHGSLGNSGWKVADLKGKLTNDVILGMCQQYYDYDAKKGGKVCTSAAFANR